MKKMRTREQSCGESLRARVLTCCAQLGVRLHVLLDERTSGCARLADELYRQHIADNDRLLLLTGTYGFANVEIAYRAMGEVESF